MLHVKMQQFFLFYGRNCRNFVELLSLRDRRNLAKSERVVFLKRFIRLLSTRLMAALLSVLIFAQVALAAPSLTVKVDGGTVSSGQNKLVLNKKVTISVYDNNGQTTGVTINGKAAKTVTGQAYTWDLSYSMVSSKDDINITANSVYGSVPFNFSLMYVSTPVPGLSQAVTSLPSSGKIEAFNKALTLTYPKDNLLVDSSNNPLSNQQITLETLSPTDVPDKYHSLASPVIPIMYRITSAAGAKLLQPGKLTLAYDAGISSSMASQLGIWYSPDPVWNDTDDNRILGGYVEAGKRTISVPLQTVGDGYYAVFLAQQDFDDFQGTDGALVSWSYSSVMPLWAKGIVERNVFGTTPPYNGSNYFGLINGAAKTNITRLEFATMMVKGLGLPVLTTTNSVFADVTPAHLPTDAGYFGAPYSSAFNYYAPGIIKYVETAAQNGIINGYFNSGTGNREFKPMQNLTRQEAAVIMARAANLKLSDDDEKAKKELDKIFEDASSISIWAAPSVLAAYKAKLIVGVPGTDPKKFRFNPASSLSRAEAITFTYRLLKQQKKI